MEKIYDDLRDCSFSLSSKGMIERDSCFGEESFSCDFVCNIKNKRKLTIFRKDYENVMFVIVS